ncbi:MAG TPA: LamG domain-containing protein, partial [Patescibacteria group bacterium]|nr:LamG domain-containing protein [Patescibacteria group bacterium]
WYNGRNGKYNASLYFDDNDYVNAGDISQMNSATYLSISAWMKRDVANNKVIIQKGTGSTSQVVIDFWSDGSLYFENDNGGDGYGGIALNDTNWHHVVLVFDGTQSGNNKLKGYVDGKLASLSYTGTIQATTPNMSGQNFYIGRSAGSYSDGQIDDVKLFSYPLTAAQVKTLYNQGSATRFGPISGTP